MSFEERSNENTVVALSGELNILRAAELATLLIQSLQNSLRLDIDMQEVASIDLSCLQVLCSAHRTATTMGKSVTIQQPLPALIKKALQLSGFKRRKGCSFSKETFCLCCGGEG